MLVTIEGSKEVIDTNSLLDKRIDSGKDGDVYRLNDNEVIKLCNSCLMTEEKIKDLRECVTEEEERTTSLLKGSSASFSYISIISVKIANISLLFSPICSL